MKDEFVRCDYRCEKCAEIPEGRGTMDIWRHRGETLQALAARATRETRSRCKSDCAIVLTVAAPEAIR